MSKQCDFTGWATKNDIQCSDGRIIRQNAFKDSDGCTVPLVWMHQHSKPANVLGHALLENRPEGVFAYCTFNDTEAGKNSKLLVQHGDIVSLSIYANQLQQSGPNVMHGMIREVSLVMAGANPGASIQSVTMAHSDGSIEELEDQAIIYTGENIELAHGDIPTAAPVEPEKESMPTEGSDGGELMHADGEGGDGGKTVKDVFDSFTEEQKQVVYFLIGQAVKQAQGEGSSDEGEGESDMKHNEDEGESDMKYNAFDGESEGKGGYLAHSMTSDEQNLIISDMKRFGSLKESFLAHQEEMGIKGINYIAHSTDIERSENVQNYGVNDPSFLFPEARSLNNPPAFISRRMDWVAGVMSGTSHTPFSRIKSVFADITEDEARAKGYIKGKTKKEEVFSLLKRTTTPTTVYKKQKMDRDDIIDITDFDIVAWLKGEMRIMLDEEIARAVLIGDGRLVSDDDHIDETNIRPIWKDDPLFTINATLKFAANATDDDKAKSIIKAAVKSRKEYRGSGTPTFFTTEDTLTDMLLLEDGIGHRLYKSETEVAQAMRVSKIVTVPVFENQTRAVDGKTRTLIGLIVNLRDYTIGADKGGSVNMFDDFDIDVNQQKYLIETRCSGALTVPYSAIALESESTTT